MRRATLLSGQVAVGLLSRLVLGSAHFEALVAAGAGGQTTSVATAAGVPATAAEPAVAAAPTTEPVVEAAESDFDRRMSEGDFAGW